MTLPLHIRMAQDAFIEWCHGRRQADTNVVRDKRDGKVYRVLEAEWNGSVGIVRCKLLLDERRFPEYRFEIKFHNLEHLNGMEVIAACAASESHLAAQ